jgi:hypothetical protein
LKGEEAMRAYDELDQQVQISRPDYAIRLFALRLGLEVIEQPGSDIVVFRRRPRRMDNAACAAHIAECHDRIGKETDVMRKAVVAKYEADVISVSEALAAMEQIMKWHHETTERVCRCGDGPQAPKPEELRRTAVEVGFIGAAGIFGISAVLFPPLGFPLAVCTFLSGLFAVMIDNMVVDPPDPNFTELPSVVEFNLPELDTSELDPKVAAALMELLGTVGKSLSAGSALVAAFEKFQGATLAGDGIAATRQLGAAADFAELFADSLEALVGARTGLVAVLRMVGEGRMITEDEVLDLLSKGVIAEPPQVFRDAAALFHVQGAEIEDLWGRIVVNPLAAVGVFPELLSPSELAKAEANLATALRSSAIKWRG